MPNPDTQHARTRQVNQAKVLAAISGGANTHPMVVKATGISTLGVKKHLLWLVASGQVVKTVRSGASSNPSTYAISAADE